MGIWGSELYDNDSACDVRDGYLDFIQDGLDNENAYIKTMEVFHEYIGDQDEPLLWFALAETQWRVGRLRQDVKDKALEWIEKNGYLDMWTGNPKGEAGWKKTLLKLKEKLEQPIPKERKIPKLDLNPWNLHDVYAYQFHKEKSKENGFFGKYMLIQKIGEKKHEKERLYMHVQVIDHVFDSLPELDDINKYRILPLEDLKFIKRRPLQMNGVLPIVKPSEYPKKYLTFLGTTPGPANKELTLSFEGLSWSSLEYFLPLYSQFWEGREYETVEEGVYRYNLGENEKTFVDEMEENWKKLYGI